MNYDIRIDGDVLNVTNLTLFETRDKSYDGGSFTAINTTKSTAYAPFTECIIIIDDNSTLLEYEFLVESDRVTPVDQEQTLFDHQIRLTERTVILDNKVIEQRTMLQPATGTKKSITDFVDILIETEPFALDADVSTTRIMERGTTWDRLSTVDATELILPKSTMAEVFNKYADMGNGIVRLRRKAVSYLDPTTYPHNILEIDYINEKKTLRTLFNDTSGFERVRDIVDYCTEYDIDASNLINEGSEESGIIYEPNINDYYGFRADTGNMDESNAYLRVNFAKYKKKKIYMRRPTVTEGTVVLDITDYVVEQREYDQLEYSAADPTLYAGFYKANSVIWNFQSKEITGWYVKYDGIGAAFDRYAIDNIAHSAAVKQFGWSDIKAEDELYGLDVQDEEFQVSYIGFIDARTKVERSDLSGVDKKTTRIVNQSDNLLSTVKLSNSLFNEIQIVGEETIVTTMVETDDLSLLYEVGDYTSDNYILTKIELNFDQEEYIARYEWSKNFQKRNEDIAVNSQPELFAIPDDNRTVKRNLYYNCYLIAGFGDVTPESTFVTSTGIATLGNTFDPESARNKPPLHVLMRDDDIDVYRKNDGTFVSINATEIVSGIAPTSPKWIVKPITSWGGKNALNFYFEFDSPNIAGQQVYEITTGLFTDKPTLRSIQYTDQNGELDTFEMEFYKDFNFTDQKTLPLVAKSIAVDQIFNVDLLRVKKNRGDILAMTLAIQCVSKHPNDIIYGKDFVERNNLVELYSSFPASVNVYAGSGRYDNFENFALKSGHTFIGTPTINYFSNYFTISVPSTTADSWAITDSFGRFLLAVNQRKLDGSFVQRQTVTFALNKERDGINEIF